MSVETVVVWLETILRRLEKPDELAVPDLERLNQDWLEATDRLHHLSEEELRQAAANDPFLKPRLQMLVEQLARVTSGLNECKGEVSQQIMAHNRRMQSMRQGYGRAAKSLILMSRQA
ncbi:MAG: hypothetical protein HQL77_05035 [Magnetococcales bacterium]|nr:hypothetical protein [Magnetococcales bacterium]